MKDSSKSGKTVNPLSAFPPSHGEEAEGLPLHSSGQRGEKERLRFLVFGAGAIGTYIGGSMALRGHPVTFIEQPHVVEELQSRGLRLNLSASREQSYLLPNIYNLTSPVSFNCVPNLGDALPLGPFDVAVFALKSFDTEAAIQSFLPFRAEMPPILCLQNGVENEARLAATLGEGSVIAGTVTSAIGRHTAGDIFLERLRGVGVAAGHPLSERLVDAFDKAGLNARLYTSAAEMKWSKLLTNLLANATSAILDMTPAEVFAHPSLYQLEIEGLREALRVMKALSLKVVDLPGTPVRLLALGARLPLTISKPLMQRSVGKGRGAKMPSFHIDLYAGRGKSEVDYLNGAVVRFGERLDVPTPINRLLCETLLALTEGKIPMDVFRHKPAKLLDKLGDRN